MSSSFFYLHLQEREKKRKKQEIEIHYSIGSTSEVFGRLTNYVLLDASLLWCPENFELKDGPAGWFLGDDYRTSRVLWCFLRSYISSPQAAMEVIQQQGPIAGCEELFLSEITEIDQTLCIEGLINNQHLHTPNLDLQQKCSGHNHPGTQQKSCHQSSQVKRKCLRGAPTLQIPELYLNQVDFAFRNHPS